MKKGLIQLILISSFYFVSQVGVSPLQDSVDHSITNSITIPDGEKDDPGTLE
ncbi:hypothetical protein [Rossellomorea vietnamensis]|uniref:hypothetical protein n=1 Tax=Rossellomorea vietnamensis TaxID=218284 RepID=UPI003D2D9582